ncbi:MAG: CDP-diacylglycerol--serine O-phosphatidyltransferase [Pseudomonadota bacterium]
MDSPFPPFDPDGDDDKPAVQQDDTAVRLRDIPLRTIFPNLLTLLAICSGLTAIRFAIEGSIELAVAAIIFAGFLDGIDGRVARFLKSTTRFGAEMDSLADFVNFGVAPAILLYFTMLSQVKSLGWIAALIYASCACLRLARFNVMLDNPDQPKWRNRFFIGVPAPAGALAVLLPVYLTLLGVPNDPTSAFVATGYTMICGFLMVSNLPTFSGKDISQKVRRDLVLPFMILAVFLAAVVISYPWEILTAFAVLYLCSLPISYRNWLRYLRQDEQQS